MPCINLLWTCELTRIYKTNSYYYDDDLYTRPTITWKATPLNGSYFNQLVLKSAVLGVDARQTQPNIVAIVTKEKDGKTCERPVLSLTFGQNNMVSNLDLTVACGGQHAEVGFKLVSGDGPVTIICNNSIELDSQLRNDMNTFFSLNKI